MVNGLNDKETLSVLRGIGIVFLGPILLHIAFEFTLLLFSMLDILREIRNNIFEIRDNMKKIKNNNFSIKNAASITIPHFLFAHTAEISATCNYCNDFNFLLNRTEQKSGPHMVQYSEPC